MPRQSTDRRTTSVIVERRSKVASRLTLRSAGLVEGSIHSSSPTSTRLFLRERRLGVQCPFDFGADRMGRVVVHEPQSGHPLDSQFEVVELPSCRMDVELGSDHGTFDAACEAGPNGEDGVVAGHAKARMRDCWLEEAVLQSLDGKVTGLVVDVDAGLVPAALFFVDEEPCCLAVVMFLGRDVSGHLRGRS